MYDKILQLKTKSGIEEIITEESLKSLFEKVKNPNHYIGFEISGKVHIGQGIGTMKVIKKLQEMGVNCTIFLADLHTYINDKLGGDKEFIRRTAKEYFIPMFNAAADIVGADKTKINYVMGYELYSSHPEYLETLLEVSKNTTLSRIQRSISIMGRKEGESIDFAKLIYPSMQVADIFTMNIHIAHAGMDQRKAHVVAIESAMNIQGKFVKDDNGNPIKPVAIHHRLVAGLAAPSKWPLTQEEMNDPVIKEDLKMSKSKPGSAINLSDSEEVIKATIKKAFCPPNEIKYNPVLEWVDAFVFDLLPDGASWTILRDEKWGGNKSYSNIDELKQDFIAGNMSGEDIKNNLAEWLIKLLEPARKIAQDASIQEIIEKIEGLKKTR